MYNIIYIKAYSFYAHNEEQGVPMSISWTRVFGLSMIVCLIAILAAPAMAAGPYHSRIASPVSRRIGTPGLLGHGMNIFASLLVMGLPVVGPLAMLSEAKNLAQRFITPSSRGAAGALTGNLHPGWNRGTINRTTIPAYPAWKGAPGTMAVGYAENLTAYLAGKGYNVSDLNTAISDAHAALASSNTTALGSAMMTFRKDLDAKVTAGTMNRTVIQDFLRTMPTGNWGIPAGRGPARVRGPMGRAPRGCP
jgi:hypothetical protein